jgi:hypothetical protein
MVLGGNRGALPKETGKDAKRSAKGSKKGLKWCTQWVTVTTSYDDDKEVDEDHVMAVKRDFKR